MSSQPLIVSIPTPPSSPVLYYSPPSPTLCKSLKVIFTTSWINVLLIFVPLGYIAFELKWNTTWVFVLNFLAIIPLAILFEFAAESVSLRVTGCLLNTTFSNTIESIVFIVALKEGQIRIVQASILGSIISNLLLVLGMRFIVGEIYHRGQSFNVTAAQTALSSMSLAYIISNDDEKYKEILNLSHGTAIILLITYILYLLFHLKTHTHFYQAEEENENDEQPQLTLIVSLLLLAVVTVSVSFSADYLADSIEGIVESHELNKTFVGLILIPNIKKISEIVGTLASPMKNKMDLHYAIHSAVGSSMQIALFVSPLLVILGWIIGQQMTLFFHTFETIILFASVMMTYYLIQGGETHWLKGAIFLATYVIIALATYFYPN
ncbi:calcium/proton exchanger [Rhizophagus irregularis]|uniref:Vacuolar calcium ion transporter n=1 Tax=Rhizophagus irregularis TaxID=588596 RepID=A0A2N1N5G6_9GLOM|nr:calcium/proton exchanger [Rhizophagus irregularis]